MSEIRLSRVYDREPRPAVASSTELRRWFNHNVERWAEFRERYETELAVHPHVWQQLVDAVAKGDVTLLYSSRDREHNNAVALRDYLQSRAGHRP